MKWLIGLVVVVALSPVACLAQALADKVPADAVVYLGWKGADNLGPGYDGSHLKAVVDASQWKAFVDESLPKLVARVAREDRDTADTLQAVLDIGGPMWRHPSAICFSGVDTSNPQEPNPKVALLCDAGDDAPALVQHFNDLIAKGGPDMAQHITAKTIGGLVVVASYAYTVPDQGLSTSKDFQAAMAQVVKDPVGAFYLDGAGLIAIVDKTIDQIGDPDAKTQWPQIRDGLGLTGLKKIVWGDGFDGKDWVEQVFVDAPAPRTGLLKLLDSEPLSDTIIKTIPATSSMAGAGRFDLLGLFTAIHDGLAKFNPDAGTQLDQGIDQVNQMLGIDIQKDFLGAMGPEWAYYVDPTTGGDGFLGLTVVNQPRDGAALENSLGAIEKLANLLLQQNLKEAKITLRFREAVINGVHVHYFDSPMITPAWAIKDGTWYMGLYPQAVASATSRAADAKSILDNPSYAAVMKRLGGPDKVSGFSYLDLPHLAPQGYQSILGLTRMYPGFGDLFGLDTPPMLLPTFDKIMPELAPAGGITWTDDAGFHMKRIVPFPGGELFASSSMGGSEIAETSLMMSILLPSLNRARETANRVKCASNERQIGQAILLYTNDMKGKYPPNLGELIKTEDITMAVFICPSGNTALPPNADQMTKDQQADWVNQHSDYVYIGANLTAGADPGTVVLYEKDDDHGHDGMNMLFGDGHVEFDRLFQAKEMIEKSKAANNGEAPQ